MVGPRAINGSLSVRRYDYGNSELNLAIWQGQLFGIYGPGDPDSRVPARFWRSSLLPEVLAGCISDIRSHQRKNSTGPFGSPVFICAGKTSLSQTSALRRRLTADIQKPLNEIISRTVNSFTLTRDASAQLTVCKRWPLGLPPLMQTYRRYYKGFAT